MLMNDSIKRVQSQAGLSFAERENQRSAAGGKANLRPEVKQKDFMKSAGTRGYSPLARVMTLAVMLLTLATTGAWADGKTVDFPIGNDDNTGWGGSMTRNGIKIQANGSNALFDNSHPTAIFECWQGEEYVTFTISMEDGSDILGVSMTLSGDYIGSFQNLEGWTGSEATRTWSGNAKSVNLRVNGSSEETINLEVTAISVTVPAAAEPGKYTVAMAAEAGDGWTIEPAEATTTGVDKDTKITATYSGTKHVKSVTAVTKAAAPAVNYTLLSAATTADEGKVVCANGHLHDAKTAVPTGCTAVGILGKVTETGHGLILSLQDATAQTWNTINGWTSETTYAGTTLKVLPDDAARGSLTSYTKLGETTVSNWAVAQKSDYDAIFTNLGSTTGDDDGKVYDANVNAYITTGVGGTAISDYYWSATEDVGDDDYAWRFTSEYWNSGNKTYSRSVRPVLGF